MKKTFFIVGVLALAAVYFSFVSPAYSQVTSGPITGWAWSGVGSTYTSDPNTTANTGYISLNCATDPTGCAAHGNWGLTLNSDGTVTGYAWSDNAGWIRFGGLSNFPAGAGSQAVNAQFSGTTLIGWARAVGGLANPGSCSSTGCTDMTSKTNGWDGWISLGGTGYSVTMDNAGSFAGSGLTDHFAWGSTVMGWIDFSHAAGPGLAPPTCQLLPTTQQISSAGQPMNFTYTTTGSPTSITFSVDGGAPITPSGGAFTVSGLTANAHNIQMIVSSGGSQGYCAAAITPPTGVIVGNDPSGVGGLTANPTRVRKGGQTTLSYTVSNMQSCGITATDGSTVLAQSAANGADGLHTNTVTVNGTTSYTLSCTGVDNKSYSSRATVTLIPIFQ
jgi:hypothetical protein